MDVLKVIDDKYELLREIKRGGFGVVYYGRDRLFGKPVAIKALPPELLGEARYIDLFQAEALHIARLSHHNIVRLYDIKRTADGQFYLIMEYIDGEDLGKTLATCQKLGRLIPRHLALHIVTEACSGLEYAHSRRDPETHASLNIVHQDISPSNIMLTRGGEVKLIDFGMAGIRHRRVESEHEVVIKGKLGYLAPEQVDGSGAIDRRTDIFALGIVLFELLTGERFLKTENPGEAVEVLRTGRWSLAALEDLAVPEALATAAMKAMQRDPAKRFQSMNQFFLDLMNYQARTNASDDFAAELEEFLADLSGQKATSTAEPARSTLEEHHTPHLDERSRFTEKTLQPADIEDDQVPQEPPEMVADINELLDAGAAEGKDHNGHDPSNESSMAEDFATIAAALDAKLKSNEKKKTVAKAPPAKNAYFKMVEDEDDVSEMRTIIDVVRLSARSHVKEIFLAFGALVLAFLLFSGLDTAFQWTSYGSRLYDAFFPPAIKVVSFPAGAQVFLDDKPLAQPTPVGIDKISPGVHKLTLTLPGFDPVVKSIQVPRKGKIRVAGGEVLLSNQPYVFRFKVQLEINSKPAGAEVFLNGVKYTQPTPCRVVWEVGDPLHVEMQKPGFQRLSGLVFNTVDGTETIEDRRLWRFQRIEEQREYYAVDGMFAKAITISSVPSKAEIYLDGGTRPVGVSGYNDRMLLTVGVYNITLKKSGYLSKSFTVLVDESTPSAYSEVLSRVVRVTAVDASSGSDKDIGARIVQIDSPSGSTRVRATTPAQLTLSPYPHTVILTRDGYDNFILSIPSAGNQAVAKMQPHRVAVEIVIFDELTSEPLSNVQISQQPLSATDDREQLFGATDSTGVTVGELPVGQYRLRARKPGYRDQTRNLSAALSSKNRIVFKMSTLDAANH